MAKNTQISDEAANAACNAIVALANGGKIKFLTAPQPADVTVAITTQTELGENTLPNPAFSAASGGVATSNPISPANATATGDAAWFRVYKSDGVTAIWDGTIGTTSDFNMVVNTVSISTGLSIEPQSIQFDVRNSTTGY